MFTFRVPEQKCIRPDNHQQNHLLTALGPGTRVKCRPSVRDWGGVCPMREVSSGRNWELQLGGAREAHCWMESNSSPPQDEATLTQISKTKDPQTLSFSSYLKPDAIPNTNFANSTTSLSHLCTSLSHPNGWLCPSQHKDSQWNIFSSAPPPGAPPRALAKILRARASEHSSNFPGNLSKRQNFVSTFKLDGAIQ